MDRRPPALAGRTRSGLALAVSLLVSCSAGEGTEAGECTDGVDNDADEYTDCLDNGCWGSPACDEDSRTDTGVPVDTAGSDSGTPDSGTPDSGSPDSGTSDSGSPETGTIDSGSPETGTIDSGTHPDSGGDSADTSDSAVDTDTASTSDSAAEDLCDGRTTGTTVGTCAENFTLPDATGAEISLYDYGGNVILLELSGFT